MFSYELVLAQWEEVDRDVRSLLNRSQNARNTVHNALKNTPLAWMLASPGRILLPFDSVRHDGLCARLDAVRTSLDAYCRQLDERNRYKQRAYEITKLRDRIGGTQRLLDQWYCDSK